MRILDSAKRTTAAVVSAAATCLVLIGPAMPAWADPPVAPGPAGDPAPPAAAANPALPAAAAGRAPQATLPSATDARANASTPVGVPHLLSPDNLPPYTTTSSDGSQDQDRLSYLRDVWHAIQSHEVSPSQALVLLAQRPMDPGAAPPPGLPAGPQAPPPVSAPPVG
ncbi:hypothetical protein [Mycobacterium sp. OTB74]|uniref:hypothetical protein n=1 Tax=Mycobacterium sp. OTB74 TaxID=1853452 RepID=UPI0024760D1F|nr:hypothetical protein [Mycobacterium sp. OTB74]MDH6247323.1 hypothetical protein [Mycobacterium sp. OTB74]